MSERFVVEWIEWRGIDVLYDTMGEPDEEGKPGSVVCADMSECPEDATLGRALCFLPGMLNSFHDEVERLKAEVIRLEHELEKVGGA